MTKTKNSNSDQSSGVTSLPYDVAVVIPTILRPQLLRAVESVFAQDFRGRVQILLGVDLALGPQDIIEQIKTLCPTHMRVDILDFGYSTSQRHGGIYAVWAGGSLRTSLSYLANSPLVAYLDDDNWWAVDHLSSLVTAIDGFDWAFSLRWYVDPTTMEKIAIDRVESVGPGKGVYNKRFGGFVDTNCLMINKINCHWALPAWTVAIDEVGNAPDRAIFHVLKDKHSVAWTDKATAFYVPNAKDLPVITKLLSEAERSKLLRMIS